MDEVELREALNIRIALLLVPLSALVLVGNRILFHLSVLSGIETGAPAMFTSLVGWGLFITSVTYLVVSQFV